MQPLTDDEPTDPGPRKATGYRHGEPVEIELHSIGGHHFLVKEAADAFWKMASAAAKDGLSLIVNSAWRSMMEQHILWDRYQSALVAWSEGRVSTKPAPVAKPGYSPHQSGVAVDLNRNHDNGRTDKWLADNALLFGFVRDVPGELWHFTYRGV